MTVALAEFLALENYLGVLVIDVDPQTNATVCLISQKDWQKRNDDGQTLAQLFADKISGTKKFKIDSAIIHGVSNVHSGINGLDLLPSSVDLIQVQDRLPMIAQQGFWKGSPVTVLEEAMEPVLRKGGEYDYDYVLIDCPPNLGLITQNALKISDSFIIPVIPDILSSLGIPQILQTIKEFETSWKTVCDPLGIILSKVRSNSLHGSMTAEIKDKAAHGTYPEVWKTALSETSATAAAMDFDASPNTLRQKYGYGYHYAVLHGLKEEFLERCPV
jgi:chromosome partitioning protein